jgi:hypothetical protein
MSSLAVFGEQLKEGLEYTRATEPPESLPNAVALAEFSLQSAACDAMCCEVVHCLQKFRVVVTMVTTPRSRRVKHLQHDRPILLRHPRQHHRLPDTDHAVIRTRYDSKIAQILMSGFLFAQPRQKIFLQSIFYAEERNPTLSRGFRGGLFKNS